MFGMGDLYKKITGHMSSVYQNYHLTHSRKSLVWFWCNEMCQDMF